MSFQPWIKLDHWFFPLLSQGLMTTDPSWSILVMTQNVCDTMDHRAAPLIQRFGSRWMALGRHLSGVDPNDPCFWSRTPKFFVIDRAASARVRAGWSLHVSIDFFFLWIIAYYYYYLASRRHSAMIQPHGSTWISLDHKTYFSTRFYDPNVLTCWIIKHTLALGIMIQMY